MKLLIRNLARTTTEEDLRALFEVYGKDVDGNSIRVKKAQPKPDMDPSKE